MELPTNITVSEAFLLILARQRQMHYQATAFKLKIETHDTPADECLNLLRFLMDSYNLITLAKQTPGLLAYAKEQFGDDTYDMIAELNANLAASLDVVDGINSSFPKYNEYLLKDKIINRAIESRVFTVAQLAGLVPLLAALLATFVSL